MFDQAKESSSLHVCAQAQGQFQEKVIRFAGSRGKNERVWHASILPWSAKSCPARQVWAEKACGVMDDL